MKTCPFCAEQIQDEAKKCRHCGEWLEDRAEPTKAPTSSTKFNSHQFMRFATIFGVPGLVAGVVITAFRTGAARAHTPSIATVMDVCRDMGLLGCGGPALSGSGYAVWLSILGLGLFVTHRRWLRRNGEQPTLVGSALVRRLFTPPAQYGPLRKAFYKLAVVIFGLWLSLIALIVAVFVLVQL